MKEQIFGALILKEKFIIERGKNEEKRKHATK